MKDFDEGDTHKALMIRAEQGTMGLSMGAFRISKDVGNNRFTKRVLHEWKSWQSCGACQYDSFIQEEVTYILCEVKWGYVHSRYIAYDYCPLLDLSRPYALMRGI